MVTFFASSGPAFCTVMVNSTGLPATKVEGAVVLVILNLASVPMAVTVVTVLLLGFGSGVSLITEGVFVIVPVALSFSVPRRRMVAV